MFGGTRDETLTTLAKLGGSVCCYAGQWPLNTCDCKYGGPETRTVKGIGGKVFPMMSEQTGCPELRTLYTIVAAMTDAEWDDLSHRAGNIGREELRQALNDHFGEAA